MTVGILDQPLNVGGLIVPAARPLGSIAAERWKGWYPLAKAKRDKTTPWGERANSRRKRDKGIGCGGLYTTRQAVKFSIRTGRTS